MLPPLPSHAIYSTPFRPANRRRLVVLLIYLVGPVWGLISCRPDPVPAPPTETVTVFAAASLNSAFSDLGQVFSSENRDVRFLFNFAGSQQLARQLLQGAAADLFASADERQMGLVVDAGLAAAAEVAIFTSNRLVLVVPSDNPAAIEDPADLARPGIKLVLAGEEVPAGRYTRAFLAGTDNHPAFPPGFADAALANVVSYENDVMAVWTKVNLGEADAGIVYQNFAGASEGTRAIPLPEDINPTAIYPLAVLSLAPHRAAAVRFRDFVLSPRGQAILESHGFTPLPDS